MSEINSSERDQALLNIENLLKINSKKGWSREWDDKLDEAYKAAETLRIKRVEINRVELKITDPEERQEMFTDWINTELDGMSLDDMIQLRDEFGLKG